MRKKIVITVVIIAALIGFWFAGYYNYKSTSNLPQGKNSRLMAYFFMGDAPFDSDKFTISRDGTAGNKNAPSIIFEVYVSVFKELNPTVWVE